MPSRQNPSLNQSESVKDFEIDPREISSRKIVNSQVFLDVLRRSYDIQAFTMTTEQHDDIMLSQLVKYHTNSGVHQTKVIWHTYKFKQENQKKRLWGSERKRSCFSRTVQGHSHRVITLNSNQFFHWARYRRVGKIMLSSKESLIHMDSPFINESFPTNDLWTRG